MSIDKATPGPWQVAMRPEIDGERMPDGSGGCSHTGRMEYDREFGVCTKEDLEQGEYDPEPIARPWNEADAHLISAAPELYEACRAFRSAVIDHSAVPLPPSMARALFQALERADAAVRKAEGQDRSTG